MRTHLASLAKSRERAYAQRYPAHPGGPHGSARMPIWGVSAILSNLLLAVFSKSRQRWFYFASLLMLILFVIFYNLLSKPIKSASNRSGKNRRKTQQWSRATGVVEIGNDPCSAARFFAACPVPRVASRFGVNMAGALPFQPNRDRCRWRCQPGPTRQ